MVERSKIGLVALAMLLGACDVDFVSESGRVALSAEQFHHPGIPRWESGGTMAVGSEVCLHFQGWFEEDLFTRHQSDIDDCFELSAEGVAELEGRCLSLDEPGETTVHLRRTSVSCPGDLSDDTLVIRAVAPEQLRTAVYYDFETITEPDGWTREQLVVAPGEVVPVVEGASLSIEVGLQTRDSNENVAWTHGDVLVTPADPVDDPESQPVELRLAPGETRALSLRVGGVETEPAILEAVPASSLQDFELLLFLDEDYPGFAGLRAFARDDQGRPVQGVPARWSLVEGDVKFSASDVDPSTYAHTEIECHEPGREPVVHTLSVEARLGDEVRTVTWEQSSAACSLEEPTADAGCGCSSTGPSPKWPQWTFLGMVVAALRPRRRR
ncbi:MAG: MYXO-CTERM sorting domain-containing protein [Myxococcota bacterium]